MKIRNGFVSNSSSCSFLVIIGEDAYKNAYEKCSDNAKKYLDNQYKHNEKLKIYFYTWIYECNEVLGSQDLPDESFIIDGVETKRIRVNKSTDIGTELATLVEKHSPDQITTNYIKF